MSEHKEIEVLKSSITGVKFWVAQNLIEVVVILGLSYAGLDLEVDFCSTCLLIENFEGIVWGISFKLLLFLLPYITLFVLSAKLFPFTYAPKRKYAIINFLTSILIMVVMNWIRHFSLSELMPPLLVTTTSALIILFATFANKTSSSHY